MTSQIKRQYTQAIARLNWLSTFAMRGDDWGSGQALNALMMSVVDFFLLFRLSIVRMSAKGWLHLTNIYKSGTRTNNNSPQALRANKSSRIHQINHLKRSKTNRRSYRCVRRRRGVLHKSSFYFLPTTQRLPGPLWDGFFMLSVY